MRIEIKSNQIVVQFSEKETSFIAQKAGEAKIDDVTAYIERKITEAFTLEELENISNLNLGNDFNLNKIKNVTDELKKRKEETSNTQTKSPNLEKNAEESKKANLSDKSLFPKKESVPEAKESDIELMEVGDDLLAGLLDKELLKNRPKPEKPDQ